MLVDQDVFTFQVTMHDSIFVHVFQSQDDFSSDEPDTRFIPLLLACQEGKEFATITEFHAHEPMSLVLESKMELHDVGMVSSSQNLLFCLNSQQSIVLEDQVFADALHGTDCTIYFMFGQEDLTHGTSTDDLNLVEVLF
jgi:hypothetical protein